MRLAIAIALVTFVLDQVTKWVVVDRMALAQRGAIDVFPPYLNLRMAWNDGVNFGLGDFLGRWVLVGIALVIVVLVIWWVRRETHKRWVMISAGLLIGGALGNVVDRVFRAQHAVADFLNMSCCGIENPYAFNVADITIFLGAIGLVIFAGDGTGDDKRRKG